MATSLEKSEKGVQINIVHANTFYLVKKKIVKIGPVYPEIIGLRSKKEEFTEGKIYSPVCKFAESHEMGIPANYLQKCLTDIENFQL